MRRWKLLTAVVFVTAIAWSAALYAVVAARDLAAELGRAERLAALPQQPQATIVFDRRGRPAFAFYAEQRVDVPLDAIAPYMIDALIAIEDRRFYRHNGIDVIRVAGAAWRNLQTGRIVQGASTITQQLARASQLSPERTYTRKLREVMLAVNLEDRYTKAEILERYLNTVYFGDGSYGVETASRGYFGKSASQLALHEAALLAALVRSPSGDAPFHAPARARARRNLVLRLMHRQGRIDAGQLARAVAAPLPDAADRRGGRALAADAGPSGQHFKEELWRQLVAVYGEDRVLRGGLRVYSTYDPHLQRAAEGAIVRQIERLAGARKRAQRLQGSLVALDPNTGDVLALVGGRDIHKGGFNRAVQARRQAGSAFKPIVFAAALERGYAPGTLLRDLDTPIDAYEGPWLPAGDHERVEYTLRHALRVSSNRAAAQLLQQVGLAATLHYANRLGVESRLPPVPSLALGTGEVTLLELTAAYTAFANRGRVSSPRLYTRVTDARGNGIAYVPVRQRQAISPTTAFLMSSMLAEVVTKGTGSSVRSAGFRLPAAGKTGTTDDYTDAWFIGYTPHIASGVWFGFDDPAPIMREGYAAVVAAPAWGHFMRVATAGARPDWYETPPDVEKVGICRLSGARATQACRNAHIPAPPVFEPRLRAAAHAAAVHDVELSPQEQMAAASEPLVYEDLFPAALTPVETCSLHPVDPATVDDVPVATTHLKLGSDPEGGRIPVNDSPDPPSIRDTSSGVRIAIQRIVGGDGVVRTIVRQIR